MIQAHGLNVQEGDDLSDLRPKTFLEKHGFKFFLGAS